VPSLSVLATAVVRFSYASVLFVTVRAGAWILWLALAAVVVASEAGARGAADTTAPTIVKPSDVTTAATNSMTADVSFTVTATDPDNRRRSRGEQDSTRRASVSYLGPGRRFRTSTTPS
jgi:hypothetical protein